VVVGPSEATNICALENFEVCGKAIDKRRDESEWANYDDAACRCFLSCLYFYGVL